MRAIASSAGAAVRSRQSGSALGGGGTRGRTLPSPFCAAWIAASAPSVINGMLQKSEVKVQAACGQRAPVF